MLDPARLSQTGRVDAMVAADRLTAWAAAIQARMITALVEHPCTESVAPKLEREWASEEVRVSLGESAVGPAPGSSPAGYAFIGGGTPAVESELLHRLPVTLEALEAGRITAPHAMAVTDTVAFLDDAQAAVVEQAVIPAPRRTSTPAPTMASFWKKLRRAADKADPRTAAERAARAAQDRDVWLIPIRTRWPTSGRRSRQKAPRP